METVTIRESEMLVPASIARIYRDGFEPLSCALVETNVSAGHFAVDVGANFGYYTCLLSSLVGDSGSVLALEAAPGVAETLEQTLTANGLSNVQLHQVAAGSHSGTSEFWLTEDFVNSGTSRSPFEEVGDAISVPMSTIDDLVQERLVDFLKIDVQGDEVAVLEGARRSITRSNGMGILVEWAPSWNVAAGFDPAGLPAFLAELGFTDLVCVDEKAAEYRTVAEMRAVFERDESGRRWCNLFGTKG